MNTKNLILLEGRERLGEEIKEDHNKKNIKATFYFLTWIIDSWWLSLLLFFTLDINFYASFCVHNKFHNKKNIKKVRSPEQKTCFE